MGRYNFTSTGAAGGNAIQAFLVQRALQERQLQLDAQAKQQQEAENAQRERELALRQQQEQRMAADASANRTALEGERDFRRATTMSVNALPDDPLSPEDAAFLQANGYGSQIKRTPGVLSQGPQTGEDDGVPIYDVQRGPEQLAMRGGSAYLSARAAAEERKAQADKDREARTAQADSDRSMKELIARLAVDGRADSKALQNRLLELQAEIAADKLDAGRQTRTDQKGAIASTRQQVRDLAQGLLDDPTLEAISGPIDGRTPDMRPDSVDAARRLDQLIKSLSLGARGQMKGQGQISDFEGKLLSGSVSALDRTAGAANVKKHLQEIINAFAGDAPQAGPATPEPTVPSGKGFRVVGQR